MALTKCPDCGREVPDPAKECPNCGRSVEAAVGAWAWALPCGCIVYGLSVLTVGRWLAEQLALEGGLAWIVMVFWPFALLLLLLAWGR